MQCPVAPGPKPLLSFLEYKATEALGGPIRFALYSDKTIIYRDRKNAYGGFLTGTVDDEEWKTLQKIVVELPAVTANIAFTLKENEPGGKIIFNDGKRMRELSIYGPFPVKRKGTGDVAAYSTSAQPVQTPSPLYNSGEISQSVMGAWYEIHNFVPKDVHPWVPEHFEVSLHEGESSKTVSWSPNWPKLDAATSNQYSGLSMQMPGKYLNDFERVFRAAYTAIRFSGRTFFVRYSIPLPSEHVILNSIPLGVREEAMHRPKSLPTDFLKTTKISEIKKIAKERGYDMHRIVNSIPGSNGVGFASTSDVVDELCQSNDSEEIDAGLELKLESKHSVLHAASVIASTHTPDFIQSLIIRHIADKKFLAVITPLIQESVARGANYDNVELIRAFWQGLAKQNDPLTWLPLHRMDIEETITFPSYGNGGSVAHLATSSISGKLEKQPTQNTPGKPFTAVEQSLNPEAAARCVRSWTKGSNGKFEAKLFETSVPISAADISTKQLLKLRLDCLAKAMPSAVKLETSKTENIFHIAFSAASNGGAYTQGEGGAYGRLAAWQSLAELTGVRADGTFDDAYKAVKQSDWYSLSSTSEWFHNVAWDFGIVCLRPDKRHVSVLAASDED